MTGVGRQQQVEDPKPPPLLRIVTFGTLAALVIGVVIGQTFAWMVAEEATPGNVPWWAPWSRLDSTQVYDIVRSVVAAIAVIGAGGAAFIAYRRQAVVEAQQRVAERELRLAIRRHELDEDTGLRQRYATAAEQLGHASAAVRLAGVYALSQLADEWGQRGQVEQKQTCIDVLCAYLRVPEKSDNAEESQVRWTILRVIKAHISKELDEPTSWSRATFDFRGSTLRDVNFDGGVFHTHVNFSGVTFVGRYTSFERVTFHEDSLFTGATFAATDLTDFSEAVFRDRVVFASVVVQSSVTFMKASFQGAECTFRAADASSGVLAFFGTTLQGTRLDFEKAVIPPFAASKQGCVFNKCVVDASSEVDFSQAQGVPAYGSSPPAWLKLPSG